MSFRRQSGHRAAACALVGVRKFSRNKGLRQFVDQKIPADLRPSADGYAVRTKSGFKAPKPLTNRLPPTKPFIFYFSVDRCLRDYDLVVAHC